MKGEVCVLSIVNVIMYVWGLVFSSQAIIDLLPEEVDTTRHDSTVKRVMNNNDLSATHKQC